MDDPAVKNLEKALYLNSAAAVLKQAEAVHGAPALKPPAGALPSCWGSTCPWFAVVHIAVADSTLHMLH